MGCMRLAVREVSHRTQMTQLVCAACISAPDTLHMVLSLITVSILPPERYLWILVIPLRQAI